MAPKPYTLWYIFTGNKLKAKDAETLNPVDINPTPYLRVTDCRPKMLNPALLASVLHICDEWGKTKQGEWWRQESLLGVRLVARVCMSHAHQLGAVCKWAALIRA